MYPHRRGTPTVTIRAFLKDLLDTLEKTSATRERRKPDDALVARMDKLREKIGPIGVRVARLVRGRDADGTPLHRRGRALALRDDYLLHGRVRRVAPFLLVFELTNGMLSATRRRRLSRDLAEEGLAFLVAAGIRLVDPARGFSLSMRWNLSAYDGAYLGLAESVDSEVWAEDRAFYTSRR